MIIHICTSEILIKQGEQENQRNVIRSKTKDLGVISRNGLYLSCN